MKARGAKNGRSGDGALVGGLALRRQAERMGGKGKGGCDLHRAMARRYGMDVDRRGLREKV